MGLVVLCAIPLTATGVSASKSRPQPTPTRTPVATSTPTATPTTTTTTGYSGTKAATYAGTYWSMYNTSYPSFANSGGDCTNFVSQALYAGGLAMRPSPPYSGTAAWFIASNGGQWSYSTPWVNSNDSDIFLLQHLPGVTQVASYVGIQPSQTVPSNGSQGDVVLYDWNNDGIFDHEAIISTANGQSVDAHTSDRHDQYWTLGQYNTQWATTHLVVLHIPAATQ